VLTFLALGEVTVLAGHALSRPGARPSTAGAFALPVAVGGFLWVGGRLLDAPYVDRSLVVLVVLGLLALAVPRTELEMSAATVAASASAEGIVAATDPSVALAVHLTVGGAIVVVSSLLHRDHRPLAWLGGLMLAAATWARLYDLGVHAPEAYTLPTAVVLVLVGLDRLHRDMETSTSTALLPGLGLAVVPTLLWALADPLSTRAVVIGAVALALVLGGATLRWTAPVLVGWLAGAVLVLRELAPWAAQTPQWMVIGAAGTVLIGAGITWEGRVRDVRRAAGYLARLR
jgi:hypothetical protein